MNIPSNEKVPNIAGGSHVPGTGMPKCFTHTHTHTHTQANKQPQKKDDPNVIAFPFPDIDEIIACINELQFRGLKSAALWLSELGIPPEQPANNRNERTHTHTTSPLERLQSLNDPVLLMDVLKAKSNFEICRYESAAKCINSHKYKTLESMYASQVPIFIRCFSSFMAGNEQLETSHTNKRTPNLQPNKLQTHDTNASLASNLNLPSIEVELRFVEESTGVPLDGLNLWLLGVVLRDMGRRSEARVCIIESLNKFPYNWSAWVDLVSLLVGGSDVTSPPDSVPWDQNRLFPNDNRMTFKAHTLREFVTTVGLPFHIMSAFGYAEYLMAVNKYESAPQILADISEVFPSNAHAIRRMARCAYMLKSFSFALKLFKDLSKLDENDLSYVEDLAEILHSRNQLDQLSNVAANCMRLDRFSPATCCVVGQYYSARMEFTQAVKHYRRAVLEQNNYVNAWILLGNAFLEVKKTQEAQNAYEIATRLCPTDYRGWFGLGQVNELSNMQGFALYYYHKSAQLWDGDHRVWKAIASVCQKESRYEDAVACLNKAWLLGKKQEALIALFENCKILGWKEKAVKWAQLIYSTWVVENGGTYDLIRNTFHIRVQESVCEDADMSVQTQTPCIDQISQLFRGCRPVVCDALNFLMKYYLHLSQSTHTHDETSELLEAHGYILDAETCRTIGQFFASLLLDIGDRNADEARNIVSENIKVQTDAKNGISSQGTL